MRIGLERGRSEREWAAAREFRNYVENDAREQQERSDREQWAIYRDDLNAEQAHTPPALRMEPLSYEEWAKFLPADEPDPVTRRVIATNAALNSTLRRERAGHVREAMSDDELIQTGFDLAFRANSARDVDQDSKHAAVREFLRLEPTFDIDSHWDSLSEFFQTQRLQPNITNLLSAFWLLRDAHVITPVAPKPAPAPNELNRHGVNLNPAPPSPEQERQQRRHDFFNKVIKVDPVTKQTYTEAQLDKLSADEYKRLMIGEFKTPTMADVIKGNLK